MADSAYAEPPSLDPDPVLEAVRSDGPLASALRHAHSVLVQTGALAEWARFHEHLWGSLQRFRIGYVLKGGQHFLRGLADKVSKFALDVHKCAAEGLHANLQRVLGTLNSPEMYKAVETSLTYYTQWNERATAKTVQKTLEPGPAPEHELDAPSTARGSSTGTTSAALAAAHLNSFMSAPPTDTEIEERFWGIVRNNKNVTKALQGLKNACLAVSAHPQWMTFCTRFLADLDQHRVTELRRQIDHSLRTLLGLLWELRGLIMSATHGRPEADLQHAVETLNSRNTYRSIESVLDDYVAWAQKRAQRERVRRAKSNDLAMAHHAQAQGEAPQALWSHPVPQMPLPEFASLQVPVAPLSAQHATYSRGATSLGPATPFVYNQLGGYPAQAPFPPLPFATQPFASQPFAMPQMPYTPAQTPFAQPFQQSATFVPQQPHPQEQFSQGTAAFVPSQSAGEFLSPDLQDPHQHPYQHPFDPYQPFMSLGAREGISRRGTRGGESAFVPVARDL
ncbi:hypothetical protein JCM10908_002670 [Rhodotorula pacifica]|uniref:uncharacterized protein n=1 Tax=Rhodotorula pacifica TaxID=1495444 RepID=UPI00317E6105